MKEKIQQLIANGKVSDALQLLTQFNSEALLLQAQYKNGETQFNLGLIEFTEWQKIQNRICFSALQMIGTNVEASVVQSTTATIAVNILQRFLEQKQKIENHLKTLAFTPRNAQMAANALDGLLQTREASEIVAPTWKDNTANTVKTCLSSLLHYCNIIEPSVRQLQEKLNGEQGQPNVANSLKDFLSKPTKEKWKTLMPLLEKSYPEKCDKIRMVDILIYNLPEQLFSLEFTCSVGPELIKDITTLPR